MAHGLWEFVHFLSATVTGDVTGGRSSDDEGIKRRGTGGLPPGGEALREDGKGKMRSTRCSAGWRRTTAGRSAGSALVCDLNDTHERRLPYSRASKRASLLGIVLTGPTFRCQAGPSGRCGREDPVPATPHADLLRDARRSATSAATEVAAPRVFCSALAESAGARSSEERPRYCRR